MVKNSQIDDKVVKIATRDELRSLGDYKGVFSETFYIADRSQIFRYDPSDTTSADDGIDVLVNTATGRRYKRIEDPVISETVSVAVSDRLPYKTISEVRSLVSNFDSIQIIDKGKEGVFKLDSSDTTSIDDGALVIVDSSGKRYKREFFGEANTNWWGITPNFNQSTGIGTDWQTTFWKVLTSGVKDVFLPKGDYLFSVFQGNQGVSIKGEKGTRVFLRKSGSSTPSMVQFASNTSISNIDFISLETDFEGSRTNIDTKENIKIENCTFTGFRDTTGAINAWGVYLKNSKRIKIINCGFSNNSQSDIAIVDNNNYITIESCYSTTEANGIHLNIEPMVH